MFEMVTQDNFIDYLQSNENVIAYFWATWCGACKAQNSILEQIIKSFPNKIKVAQIDIDRNQNLALAYQILGTPTFIFFKNGKKIRFKSKAGDRIDRFVGVQDFRRLQGPVRYIINMKIINGR
ncbi:MAG: thioredoxin family protein [Promethearchaeota archaeon]